LSAASLALWHQGAAPMDPSSNKRYAMGWITARFNGVSVVAHPGDTDVFSSEFVLAPAENWGVFVLANGSAWLSSQYVHEIASGMLSKLVGRTPRDDAVAHRVVLAIYLAVMATPLIQLFALWKSRNRAGSWLRRCWPAALHVGAAAVLIAIFPRLLFGMPFVELLWAFPDMGSAAIFSGLLAMAALTLALRGGGSVGPRASGAAP
jgi:hypothetical protein